MLTKKEKTARLTKIIEMQPPAWLTKETYNEYNEKRQELKANLKPKKALLNMFDDLEYDDVTKSPTWGSYQFQYSPKILVELFDADRIISDPTTGQDPKRYSGPNLKTASNHAARHWGWTPQYDDDGDYMKSKSQWIESGTFNLVKYPAGDTVLEPCNVEHRLWGLIGFPLDIVPIDYKEDLYYYNDDLEPLFDEKTNKMVHRMKVNGMYLSDIVLAAKEKGCDTTKDEILKSHFYSNKFNFTILPFYTKEECEHYFKEVNTSSQKTKPQLFHAESEPIMNFVKSISSPKCINFKPMGAKYHPLFELMSEQDLCKLEAMMYTYEVINFIDERYKAIDTTDDKLIQNYNKTNGYAKSFEKEEFRERVINTLDFLYSLISKKENAKMSRQLIQQLLLLEKYLEDNDFVIYDNSLFIDEFYSFYNNEQENDDGDLMPFGRAVRTGTSGYAKQAHKHIKSNFLGLLRDEEYLKTLGVVMTSSKVKRIFSQDVIMDSLEEHNGLDIDDTLLTTKPVGAHIIADMELIRMTDSERDEAFQEEGIADKFDFNLNCRASSSYHNQRMGVLRMSEYLSIINDDEKVKEARLQKYYELKAKPILI